MTNRFKRAAVLHSPGALFTGTKVSECRVGRSMAKLTEGHEHDTFRASPATMMPLALHLPSSQERLALLLRLPIIRLHSQSILTKLWRQLIIVTKSRSDFQP